MKKWQRTFGARIIPPSFDEVDEVFLIGRGLLLCPCCTGGKTGDKHANQCVMVEF